MTDVEVYQPPATPAVSGAELDVYMRQAELLAQSDIIPKDYRRKPANVLVAALTGRTFGWDALTALRNGHVIEGTWSIKPEAMLALVRRAGHSVTGEIAPDGATVRGKRRDSGDEMTVTFTMEDARRAGLAGKTNWKQYPQSMCWARAVAQLCRMLFADVTLGLSYTPEELGADVDADGAVVDAPARGPALAPMEDSPYVSEANARLLGEQCVERGIDVAQVVALATDGRTEDPGQVLKTEITAVRDARDRVAEMAMARDMDESEADEDIADAEIVSGPVEYEPGQEPF
jgi:hypothetical protein